MMWHTIFFFDKKLQIVVWGICPLFGSKESSFFFYGLRKALQYTAHAALPLKKLYLDEQRESFRCHDLSCRVRVCLEH